MREGHDAPYLCATDANVKGVCCRYGHVLSCLVRTYLGNPAQDRLALDRMLSNEWGGCVQAMGMMKNLTPEQKRMYAAMAQNMHSGGGGAATPASASTSAGTRVTTSAAAGAMQPDAQQAAGMMRDMSPEQVHPIALHTEERNDVLCFENCCRT